MLISHQSWTVSLWRKLKYNFQISSMVFDKIIYDDIHGISIGIFVFGCFSLFFPVYSFVGSIFKAIGCLKQSSYVEQNFQVHYNKMRVKFLTEYDRANPITSRQAMKDYFVFLNGIFEINA